MNFRAPSLVARFRKFLAEDVGSGDLTTVALVEPGRRGTARIVAKGPGVVAGLPVLGPLFGLLDRRIRVRLRVRDGARIRRGTVIADLAGPLRTLLTGERTALNLLQCLSGISTLTRRYVDTVSGTGVKILDTRKTTPGLRDLEKYAVAAGGGKNHRMGLHDAAMIKDNHLEILPVGALPQMIADLRRSLPRDGFVEIEAQRLSDVRRFVDLNVDVIMLDNMSLAEMRKAVRLIRARRGRRVRIEASGNMTLHRVRSVAKTGVDFISVGALTHSAPALDLSMEVRPQPRRRLGR